MTALKGQNHFKQWLTRGALVLASCPVVLLETSSLMQDTFVALVAVLVALICLRGKDPGSIKFWAVIGGLMGLAWTTKYNLANYAIPLGCCAFLRSWKVKSWKRSLGGAALGVACALLTAAPWVWNTYRLSGNPLFPLLLKTFPSPLWSDSVWPDGIVSVGRHLSPGLKGWLLWPVEMTYQTVSVEGYPGTSVWSYHFFVLGICSSVEDCIHQSLVSRAFWDGTHLAVFLTSAIGCLAALPGRRARGQDWRFAPQPLWPVDGSGSQPAPPALAMAHHGLIQRWSGTYSGKS
jgi:4-amino-4-deoxy-L-arabinose transferase-like glycosyltransferase